MKRFFLKKFITSIIFIVFLFFFSFQNFRVAYNPLVECLKKEKSSFTSLSETIKAVEGTVNDNVYGKYKFIESYKYLQKLMYKNEESNCDIIKE